jgi:hypothetical protein
LNAATRERISLQLMLKRTATYLLAIAVFLGMTLQVIPLASAMTSQSAMSMAGMDMSDCDHPAAPCKGITPDCIDSMGCLMTVALPATQLSAPVPFKWDAVSYGFAVANFAGMTLRPELSPPILRA